MSAEPPDFRAPIDPGSPEEAALAAAYARGRDDERRRATYYARILAGRAFGAPVAYPTVLDTANAISSGKAAPNADAYCPACVLGDEPHCPRHTLKAAP